MSMKRFVVSGHSMLPTLQPGDELVASDSLRPTPGDVVAFPNPNKPEHWLIKRMLDEDGLVGSDNEADSSLDSRELGPIEMASMLTMVDRLDGPRFEEAAQMLAVEEHAFARIIDTWGMPEFWARTAGFRTLVLLILEQQVSLESGAAMYRRLEELTGSVEPARLLEFGEEPLRSIGVTRQKAGYLIGLSEAVAGGELDLESLEKATVEDARNQLTSLKGIGLWTADAYLLSASRRPDMWPVGDRALQVGAAEVLEMAVVPNEQELEVLGEEWRPVRAVAARLIWHNYLCVRGREEPTIDLD